MSGIRIRFERDSRKHIILRIIALIYMDKLMRLKFNPFHTTIKHTSIGNDDYDMLTNINNISCKYYLPNDISRDIPSNDHFSILNLNIRSIINKI
jgi:hypothetical protein